MFLPTTNLSCVTFEKVSGVLKVFADTIHMIRFTLAFTVNEIINFMFFHIIYDNLTAHE